MIATSHPAASALAVAGGAAAALSVFAASGIAGWTGAGLALLMLAIAGEDARRLRIPDPLNLAAASLGMAQAIALSSGDIFPAAPEAALRGGAMALSFLALRVGFRLWRGPEGLGLGDVKLAGVAGLWLDWSYLPPAVEIAALAGIAMALGLRLLRGGDNLRIVKFPFGAMFAPAIWLCWLAQSRADLFLG